MELWVDSDITKLLPFLYRHSHTSSHTTYIFLACMLLVVIHVYFIHHSTFDIIPFIQLQNDT